MGIIVLNLPPGNYRVERGTGFSGAARNLPTMIAISPAGQTRLDIWVDTGIRASRRAGHYSLSRPVWRSAS